MFKTLAIRAKTEKIKLMRINTIAAEFRCKLIAMLIGWHKSILDLTASSTNNVIVRAHIRIEMSKGTVNIDNFDTFLFSKNIQITINGSLA